MSGVEVGPPAAGADLAWAALGASPRNVRASTASGVVGAALTAVAALALTPLVVQRLGLRVYGTWAVLATLSTLGGLADGGVKAEVVRRVGEAVGRRDGAAVRRAAEEGTGALLRTTGALLVVGLLGAPLFARHGLPADLPIGRRTALFAATLVVVAASVLLDGRFAVLAGVQRREFENLGAGAGNLAGSLVAVALLGATGLGIWAMPIGLATAVAVRTAVQAGGARSVGLRSVVRGRPVLAGSGALLSLSALVFLSQVAEVVDNQWDRIVLGRVVGATAAGQFNLGTALPLQARVPTLVAISLVPAALAQRGLDAQRFERLARGALAAAGVAAGGALVAAPAFFRWWLGAGFEDAARAARLLSLSLYLATFAALWAAVAAGRARHRVVAASAAISIVVNGVASYALARAIGFDGPLVGSLVAAGAAAVALFWLLRRDEAVRSTHGTASLAVVALGALGGRALGDRLVAGAGALVLVGLVWLAVAGATVLALDAPLRRSALQAASAAVARWRRGPDGAPRGRGPGRPR